MYISYSESKARQREAQKARDNRAEIVKALSIGEITRRDLFRWGIFTSFGTLALKNGLSPFAKSAYASVPTGVPRSPLQNIGKFTQQLNRLYLQKPHKLTRSAEGHALFPNYMGERPAKRMSYHTDFSADPGNPDFINPLTGRGPIEGRPPGEIFAHQRWNEYFPKAGYIMSLSDMSTTCRFHPGIPQQEPNKVWCYGEGKGTAGEMPPFLIKARYGEPMLMRVYNNLPAERSSNAGFGRNESQFHFHNAHNGAESDGAANVHHFPGTFYDYRWSTTLARADKINKYATEKRASGPDGNGGLVQVAGDFRELQGTMWAHDHRFFFTAENVYKGNFGAITYYSGPDRGNEELADGVNLRLPSGRLLDWGNIDFDVNLMIHDAALDQGSQLFFDIFDTDGMLGDAVMINGSYSPYFEVLPRKYRFRIQNSCISRMVKLALASPTGGAVPVKIVSIDGNLIPAPVTVSSLDVQAMAERFDIVIDFSQFRRGDRLRLLNQVQHKTGKRIEGIVPWGTALAGNDSQDPAVGPILEFRIVDEVASVDVPGVIHRSSDADRSQVPVQLTEQIPIVTPVRTRVVEFGRTEAPDARGPNGQCTPDCPEYGTFPWIIRVNGKEAHSFNANRVSMLVPKPGEVEHWTYINKGGGWDHPIHLHFEEGITMNRGGAAMGPGETLARKDVWRLRENGKVQFQVQFGEFGGAYVNHCHNTVHEDFSMLARIQLLNGFAGTPQASITPTPNPTPDGVFFTTPEVLPEGVPKGVALAKRRRPAVKPVKKV
jgi:FtsP/CotA-like multicopper oxidase with cupredoxin domain